MSAAVATRAVGAMRARSTPLAEERAERWGPLAIVLLLVLSGNVRSLSLGAGVDARPFDAAWLATAALAAPRLRALRRTGAASAAVRTLVIAGTVFLVVLVTSAVVVTVTGRGGADELASAARMVQIAAVVPFVAVLLRSRGSQRRVLRLALVVLAVVAATYALVNAGAVDDVVLLGLNPQKSASGPLVVAFLAACATADAPVRARVVAAVLGATAVAYAVSMTADLVLAGCAALGVWFVTGWAGRRAGARVASAALAAVVTLALGFVGLEVLRPDALPSNLAAPLSVEERPVEDDDASPRGTDEAQETTIEGSSGVTVLHRAIVMTAAVRVFVSSPLVGVGWTRADDPGIVDDPAIVRYTKRLFENGTPTMYPDVVPTGAHNAFLQAFADLGVLGGVPLLVFMSAAVVVALTTVRRSAASPEARSGSLAAVLLVVSGAGFLMFTGLFPTQPETVVPAIGIGLVLAQQGA